MAIARQRLGKYRLKFAIVMRSGSPLLANGSPAHVSKAANNNRVIHVTTRTVRGGDLLSVNPKL
jgi:hypothetical protein